ncbi:MAG: hypothetical protein MRY83_22120 [Flavobacteriales bacterium]|nr:hypothetical protein [Flavobacteriales bacterium]
MRRHIISYGNLPANIKSLVYRDYDELSITGLVKFVDPITNQNKKAILFQNGDDIYLIKLDTFLAARTADEPEDDDNATSIDFDDQFDDE